MPQKNKFPIPSMDKLYELNIKHLWSAFKSQNLAFISICFYLFFEYVRPHQIWTELDVLPYAQIFVILALVGSITSANYKWQSHFENKLFVLLLIVVVMSSIVAYVPSISYQKLKLFYMWLVVYFLIINIVNDEKRFFLFLLAFMLFNLKMSQHGAISFIQRGFAFTSWGVGGAPGWFQNSGEFGIEMCIFFPISLYFYLSLKKHINNKYIKLLVILAPLSALISIIASSSRGAIIGILAVFAWMLFTSKYKTKSLIGLTVLLLLGKFLMPPEFLERFDTAGDDDTSTSRLEYWEKGWLAAKTYPLLGIGFQNWRAYIGTNYPHLTHYNTVELAHNTYIEVVSELGFLGLTIYILMIIGLFYTNYKTRVLAKINNNEFFASMGKGLDGALIGFLVSSTFISTFIYPFFWMLVALSVALNNTCRNLSNNKHPTHTDT